MNKIYTLSYPGSIIFGNHCSELLPEKLKGFSRILLVTGNHFKNSDQYAKIVDSLADFTLSTISGIHAEVPLEDVDRVVLAAKEFQAQAIVAIGGGSVMDCAKAAAALAVLDHHQRSAPHRRRGAACQQSAAAQRFQIPF
mgnify:CR=1 FL=1